MKLETLGLHGGPQPDPTTWSRAVPVHRISSFVFKTVCGASSSRTPADRIVRAPSQNENCWAGRANYGSSLF
jgi:hypothetical protein